MSTKTDLEAERARFVEEKQSIEAEMTSLRALEQVEKQRCMRLGERGKRQFFDHKARSDARRAELLQLKLGVENRLRKLKARIREYNDLEHEEWLKTQKAQQRVAVAPKNVLDELWRLTRWAAQLVGDEDWQAAWVELQRWGSPR